MTAPTWLWFVPAISSRRTFIRSAAPTDAPTISCSAKQQAVAVLELRRRQRIAEAVRRQASRRGRIVVESTRQFFPALRRARRKRSSARRAPLGVHPCG